MTISKKTMKKVHIGDMIKALREERRLSQEKLADMIFVSRGTISKWEKGLASPKFEEIQLLAEQFELSLEVFAGNAVSGNQEKLKEEKIIEKHYIERTSEHLFVLYAILSILTTFIPFLFLFHLFLLTRNFKNKGRKRVIKILTSICLVINVGMSIISYANSYEIKGEIIEIERQLNSP